MLSNTSLWLTYLTGLLYAILGFLLFFLPEHFAPDHSMASYGLIVFITIAAFVYIRLFDFAAEPGGLLYFITYLAMGIPLIFVFRNLGTGAPA
jgi:hypothetical protein